MPSAWAVPTQRAAEGLRADWITRFRGHDEKAGITYADFGNEVLARLSLVTTLPKHQPFQPRSEVGPAHSSGQG
jgi:hypothetical protein